MYENRNVIYKCRGPLIENVKLCMSVYEDFGGGRMKFLAQYAAYYRPRKEQFILYPTYNRYAWEQDKARKHSVNERYVKVI